jgi:hypothetical protein
MTRQPRATKTAAYEGIGAQRFVNWARLYCRVPDLDTLEGRQRWIDAISLKRNLAIADVMVDIIRRGGRQCPPLDRVLALCDRYATEPLFDGDPAARDRNDRDKKFDGFEQSPEFDLGDDPLSQTENLL